MLIAPDIESGAAGPDLAGPSAPVSMSMSVLVPCRPVTDRVFAYERVARYDVRLGDSQPGAP